MSARQAKWRQFWPRRGDFEGFGAPESQTLIVPSYDPDTILVPSGENATDMIAWLRAFVFSLSISSLTARQANKRYSLGRGGAILSSRRTRIPYFDRPVVRSGHDLGPVRGKRHRPDDVAVGVRLLAQHLQLVCQASQQASVLAKEGRFFEGSGAPESQTLIVLSCDPDTILVPSGENDTELMMSLWAFVFSLSISSLSARQASRRQFWPRRGDFEGSGAPKSHTLIVLSADPDTILVPSGENATDRMMSLWAIVFSAT